MSPESKDEITSLVMNATRQLVTRSSLIARGLRDISSGFQRDTFANVDHAMQLYHQDKFEEAIAFCNKELEANPKDECLWQVRLRNL